MLEFSEVETFLYSVKIYETTAPDSCEHFHVNGENIEVTTPVTWPHRLTCMSAVFSR